MSESFDQCEMRFINLNSADATKLNSTYLSNVMFNFKNVLQDELDIKYCTIGLLNAQIPVSFYTINYTNYILNFSMDGGVTIPLIIQQGNYNSASLITEIISEFSLLGYAFTITTSRITGNMKFTCLSHSFTFFGTSSIFSILGFVPGQNYSSSSSIINAPTPLNLLGVKRLKVNSQLLSTKTFDSNNLGIVSNLSSIPVDVPSFGIISYVNSNKAYSILNAKFIMGIDIQIVDENNNLINFNNLNWTCTLQLNIYRKATKQNDSLLHVLNEINAIEHKIYLESQQASTLTEPEEEQLDEQSTLRDSQQASESPDNTNDFEIPIIPEDEDLGILLYNHVL